MAKTFHGEYNKNNIVIEDMIHKSGIEATVKEIKDRLIELEVKHSDLSHKPIPLGDAGRRASMIEFVSRHDPKWVEEQGYDKINLDRPEGKA